MILSSVTCQSSVVADKELLDRSVLPHLSPLSPAVTSEEDEEAWLPSKTSLSDSTCADHPHHHHATPAYALPPSPPPLTCCKPDSASQHSLQVRPSLSALPPTSPSIVVSPIPSTSADPTLVQKDLSALSKKKQSIGSRFRHALKRKPIDSPSPVANTTNKTSCSGNQSPSTSSTSAQPASPPVFSPIPRYFSSSSSKKRHSTIGIFPPPSTASPEPGLTTPPAPTAKPAKKALRASWQPSSSSFSRSSPIFTQSTPLTASSAKAVLGLKKKRDPADTHLSRTNKDVPLSPSSSAASAAASPLADPPTSRFLTAFQKLRQQKNPSATSADPHQPDITPLRTTSLADRIKTKFQSPSPSPRPKPTASSTNTSPSQPWAHFPISISSSLAPRQRRSFSPTSPSPAPPASITPPHRANRPLSYLAHPHRYKYFPQVSPLEGTKRHPSPPPRQHLSTPKPPSPAISTQEDAYQPTVPPYHVDYQLPHPLDSGSAVILSPSCSSTPLTPTSSTTSTNSTASSNHTALRPSSTAPPPLPLHGAIHANPSATSPYAMLPPIHLSTSTSTSSNSSSSSASSTSLVAKNRHSYQAAVAKKPPHVLTSHASRKSVAPSRAPRPGSSGSVASSSSSSSSSSASTPLHTYRPPAPSSVSMTVTSTFLSAASCSAPASLPANHGMAEPKKKSVRFLPTTMVQDTFSKHDYDRASDPYAACARLTALLALQIKEELNTFKLHEMVVHHQSRANTHFFL
ncbi:hypothetical protein DM01DRAFT_1384349 [Hesseltinella vesiculosa]|uniref:Uncharacterized protein n=1 Tax=Hesseltinella vesiculosa TaxID=101127 RepID=A0A1X2GDZ4_9FUNG|nr:hypothetical protein DM01DRAFT_1384349 [Hesseltinella vesiculosa]